MHAQDTAAVPAASTPSPSDVGGGAPAAAPAAAPTPAQAAAHRAAAAEQAAHDALLVEAELAAAFGDSAHAAHTTAALSPEEQAELAAALADPTYAPYLEQFQVFDTDHSGYIDHKYGGEMTWIAMQWLHINKKQKKQSRVCAHLCVCARVMVQ